MNTLTEDNLTGTNHGELYSKLPLKYLTASSMIGDKVGNDKDEHLGEIKDIMIDYFENDYSPSELNIYGNK
jgi:hypothetical protein